MKIYRSNPSYNQLLFMSEARCFRVSDVGLERQFTAEIKSRSDHARKRREGE